MSRTDERRRHAPLVGLLTFTSGCVDVVTLMAIGGAFTSVITGNLIFIGRAIGTSSLTPALHAIMAVAALLVVLNVAWIGYGASPSDAGVGARESAVGSYIGNSLRSHTAHLHQGFHF